MLQWFTGGGGYRKLAHCMNYDTFWIALTVVLDLTVAAGYVFITAHWRRNERRLEQSAAKSALGSMKRIFVLCGVCGYLFIPIKLFWPAWRLYDLFLAVLAYSTWRYALFAQELRVVYGQIDMTEQLGAELARSREAVRHKSLFLSSLSHDLHFPELHACERLTCGA